MPSTKPRRFLGQLRAFTCLLIGLALPGVAAGQQAAAGIFGQVRDESGAVLPGVSVSARSPALQVPAVTVITDAQGEYRISPLPIGLYTVGYELSGFQANRHEDLRLTVGFAAKIDVVLKVGSLEETITVSGQSPVVDVTSTTASTQFTRQTLDLLPGSRTGMNTLIAMAPGARSTWDVGGSAATEQPNFRAFGQGGEPWSTVEGVVTGAFASGANGIGNYSDYNAYEEARVATVGNGAEMPTRGMQVVAVVKSGGNQLHGGGFYTQNPTGLVSNNIDEELLQNDGINSGLPLKKRYDSGMDAGGRIVENKLWWYGALRRRRDVKYENSGVKDDGTPAENNQLAWSHTEKMSYQMSSANKLTVFNQFNHKWDVSEASALRAWEAKSNKPTVTNIAKVEWQAIVGGSFVASLQSGFFKYSTPYYDNTTGPYATDTLPGPSYTDLFTGFTGGEFMNTGRRASERSFQQVGSLSWYRPDWFLGNHQLKAGFDYIDTVSEAAYVSRQSGNYQLVFNNDAATQLRAWLVPTVPHDVTHHLGLYLSDSWTIARRLTLNLGVRGAYNPGFVPEACRDATDFSPATCHDRIAFKTFKSLVPRIHAALDVTGDGRNVIKGGWGRFPHMLYVGEVAAADPFTRTTVTYRWRDLNANRDYDPGEVNLDVNGPDFVSLAGGANTVPNPDLQQPMYDEVSGSYERQLSTDWGVRLTGIYSKTHNPYRTLNLLRPPSVYTIPVTRPDPGPDGRANTSDDPGRTFTYYEYPAALRGAAFVRNTTVNDPGADVDFTSFEIAASKRLSRNWMLIASYSATKRNVPYINGLDPGEQGTSVLLAALTPNDEINAADTTLEKTAKIAGAYTLPGEVMVSINHEFRSGEPWGRQVLFTGGVTIPNIALRVEPIGSQRLPNRNLINLSLQKSFRFFAQRKLELRANVFNLVNANTVMEVTRQSGPSYLVPTPAASYPAIMAPRIVELGFSFSF